MAEIKYVVGDATLPIMCENEKSIIVHCCNTLGAWGAGFVIPLAKHYPLVKDSYKKYIHSGNVRLGDVDEVKVTDNIYIENLIGQSFLYPSQMEKYLVIIKPLKRDLKKIITLFEGINETYSIHMPRIGCGLAGGDWNIIENIIKRTFINKANVNVYVYDLPKRKQ